MSNIQTLAWFDGELMPVQDIRVSVLSHSLHYGTGAFEGIRAYKQKAGGGGVFRLREHMDRMLDSARVIGHEMKWSSQELMDASIATLRANEMEEAYIRPLVWLGEGGMGVAGAGCPVHTMIAVWPWGAYLGAEGLKKGVRILTSSYERATGNASAKRAKLTGQYVTSFMAKRQVIGMGYEEAVLLDRDGYLTEGTGENFFMVKNGKIFTAPEASPILPGITRNTLLTLATDFGIPYEETRFNRSDLYSADEIFMCGTAAEVTPIREVDGRAVPGAPGEITMKIQKAYLDLVCGVGEHASEWITPV